MIISLFGCGGGSSSSPEVTPPTEVTPSPDHCSISNTYTHNTYTTSESFNFVDSANSIRYVNHCNHLAKVSWDVSTSGNKRIYEIYYNLSELGEVEIYARNFLTITPHYNQGELYKVSGWTTPSSPNVDENGFTNGRIDYDVENEELVITKYWQNEWNDTVRTDYEYYYPNDTMYDEFILLYDDVELDKKIQESTEYATKLN